MDVSTALLCDAASVRENLLFVLGGGITRLFPPSVPAPMNVTLALTISVHRQEVGRPHELAVDVIGEDGQNIAQVRGAFQVPEAPSELGIHELLLLPTVIPLAGVVVPAHGWYSIEISIDGHHHRTLPFRVVERPAPQVGTGEVQAAPLD